jgi:hypothetical protein
METREQAGPIGRWFDRHEAPMVDDKQAVYGVTVDRE